MTALITSCLKSLINNVASYSGSCGGKNLVTLGGRGGQAVYTSSIANLWAAIPIEALLAVQSLKQRIRITKVKYSYTFVVVTAV